MHRIFVAAILLTWAVSAFAMSRPPELNGTLSATRPYGSGSLNWLFLTVYDAALWTDAPQWSMNRPFALTLVYRMSFSTEELVDRTIEELSAISSELRQDTLVGYRAMLVRAFPAVKAGDRITALHTPGGPVRFFHNGKPTVDSQSPSFAEPFFAIWLSPNTPEPKLRAALLRLPN